MKYQKKLSKKHQLKSKRKTHRVKRKTHRVKRTKQRGGGVSGSEPNNNNDPLPSLPQTTYQQPSFALKIDNKSNPESPLPPLPLTYQQPSF
jgi:hypothetical protein